ncbi:hypothetical protein FPQ18DRAFT_14665 [Pyronema domesticum]|nr:hypothetical protein FPQ18DRAFT_14665 [Pyronema domesticum]
MLVFRFLFLFFFFVYPQRCYDKREREYKERCIVHIFFMNSDVHFCFRALYWGCGVRCIMTMGARWCARAGWEAGWDGADIRGFWGRCYV